MTRKTKPFARTLTTLRTGLGACLIVLFANPVLAAGFTSPSDNIKCYVDVYSAEKMDEIGLVCLISNAEWDLPPYFGDDDPTCDLDRTRAILLPRNGPPSEQWICHGDVFWPAPLGAISYGSQWSLFGFECSMETDGVRCASAAGNSIAVNCARRLLN
ncbi:MAG: hypothetical protein ABF288_04400 [Octadecabacter sp.]